MPSASSGTTVTTTAQIADDVIVNADINSAAAIVYSKLDLALGIVNADISASAAIVYSKLNLALGIVNADVSASAAIVDTKLAQIATASKVSGAALTSLASIPAGAGVIPAANVPTSLIKRYLTTTAVTVTNTVTETNLFSYTLPGGILGTNGGVKILMRISKIESVAGSAYCIIRLKYGTTVIATSGNAAPLIGDNGGGFMTAVIYASGASNTQLGHYEMEIGPIQVNGSANKARYTATGTGAVDSTLDTAITVTVEWSVANASNTVTMTSALVESFAT